MVEQLIHNQLKEIPQPPDNEVIILFIRNLHCFCFSFCWANLDLLWTLFEQQIHCLLLILMDCSIGLSLAYQVKPIFLRRRESVNTEIRK